MSVPDISTEATRISERLYLGSKRDAASWWFIKSKVSHVVNCADVSASGLETMPAVKRAWTLNARDEVDYPLLRRHFATFVECMASCERSDTVLVHCHEGRNRSAGLVAAFIMLVCKGRRADDVVSWLRSKRGPGLLSNPGFVQELQSVNVATLVDSDTLRSVCRDWRGEFESA